MRRLSAAAALLLASACSRNRIAPPPPELTAELESVVNAPDPGALVQLAHGFSKLESNRWRWTQRKFSAVLKPPGESARLELRFSLPQVIVGQLGPVTLKASVNGVSLPPETFSSEGDFTYSREVPSSALHGQGALVEFETDKFLPAGGEDNREFALVVLGVGFYQ